MNIHEVLERVRQLTEAESGGKVVIERDYDPSLPEFKADPDQLTQVILNITRNASQAMSGEGTITLRSRAKRQYTLGGKRHKLVCCIDIVDAGPGIPSEQLHQLFLPMVTSSTKGNGLGLSIAQMIANRHGGLIQCDSEPGHTCFTVLLPMET
ncbi:MAG: PAS domain-containing sensor histidine kinase, partial [Halieaceae bacterium]|nr:PAS domain-containing sensor histidine kinase [Halieaceae bacterium]